MINFLKRKRRRRNKPVDPATRIGREVGKAAGAAAGGLIASIFKSLLKK
jgi:hypothetical protein